MARIETRTPEQQPYAASHRDQKVLALLETLGRALTRGDGEAAAACWDVPAFVVGDRERHSIGSLEEIATFFGAAKGQYNALGITDTRPEVVRLEWPTERIAFVQVRWPYLDASGIERGEETSTYTVRLDDEGNPKLCVAVMHGARTESDRPS